MGGEDDTMEIGHFIGYFFWSKLLNLLVQIEKLNVELAKEPRRLTDILAFLSIFVLLL